MISESERWEDGCKADKVRNNFVIPNLVDFLELYQPKSILDVGCGTGYVTRQVDQQLSYRPSWTLIDKLSERISLAASKKPKSMICSELVKDFDELVGAGFQFNAIFLIFTLMEMELNQYLCTNFNRSLFHNGVTFIVVPNSLQDVYEASKSSPSLMDDFLQDKCLLSKIDKFTGEPYPFRTCRLESIIEYMLGSGHNLVGMKSRKIDEKETFLLVFQKVSEAL